MALPRVSSFVITSSHEESCGLSITSQRIAGHVDRADRICLACNNGAIGNVKHMLFECAALGR